MSSIKNIPSINDLKEKDSQNDDLTTNERTALKNFDRFRINELNKQTSETEFNKKYLQLQVKANLSPYKEFLKEKYFL